MNPWDKSRLEQEAKAHPGGWVYELDWDYGDNYVPPESFKAAWEVGADGALTGLCKANPTYSPVTRPARAPREYMQRAISNAPHLCGEWVVEIDPNFDDNFPDVPIEGQIGRWLVGKDGLFTGEFRANPHYKGTFK